MDKLKLLLAANLVSTVGMGITGYLIIWLLIDQLNQSILYGYLSIFIMVFIVLITPFTGNLIDKYSRKKIFYYSEIIGAIVLGLFLILYSIEIDYLKLILLSSLILYVNIYDTIKYPTIAALTQEMFKEEEYNKVNSSLEVQGQTALMVSSALAAFIIGSISIEIILIINISTFIVSAVLIKLIPYQVNPKINKDKVLDKNERVNLLNGFLSSMSYLAKKPFFITIVIFVSITPNIAIIVMNYLEPIFIYQLLDKGPEILGTANIIYAVGAILGGLVSIWVAKRLSTINALALFLFLFTIGTVIIYMYPNAVIFLIVSILWGFSNSSIRIFRKNFMFNHIQNDYMGRIMTAVNAIKLLAQALIIFIITTFFVSQDKVMYGYLVLSLLTIVSTLLIVASKFKKITSRSEIAEGKQQY